MEIIRENLRPMLGQHYKYKGEVYFFQGIEVKEEAVHLLTNKKSFIFTNRAIAGFFIRDCDPVEALPPAPEPNPNDEVMAELKGVIMENIRKVRTDPEYIPQAQAMAKQVQTLINLTNLELNIQKEARR